MERGELLSQKAHQGDKFKRDATLLIDIVVYSKGCEDKACEALSVLADIEKRICLCYDQLPVRRIIPQGFARERESDFEEDITVVTATYRFEYIADWCNPNKITPPLENRRLKKRTINGRSD